MWPNRRKWQTTSRMKSGAHIWALLILLGLPGLVPQARAQAVSPTAIADYQAKLAQYQAARGVYDAEADAYWDAVASKRRVRNAKRREHRSIDLDDYVLTQPPIYSGPPRPIDPQAPAQPPPERPDIPVVADFLQNASEQFGFVPQRLQACLCEGGARLGPDARSDCRHLRLRDRR
jgi:hypothetical protein